jgi:serine/threonine-protein kinase RsbW
MSREGSVVELSLESSLDKMEMVEEVARRVSGMAGFDEESEFQIEMAVHETVINAISHGNKQDPRKNVWLRFQIFGDRLEIRVRDEGRGFDVASVPDPLAEQNLLSVSGRGIFLIQKFMDEVRVVSHPGSGTEVIMIKRLNSKVRPRRGGRDREHEGHSTSS